MKRRYWVLRALACLAACMAGAMSAGPAVAYFDHYLGGTIVGTLTPAQVTALTDVFRRTLEQAPTGPGWRSGCRLMRASGRLKVADSFTPLHSRHDRGDRSRQLGSEFRWAGETEAWTGWYCKEKNGNWKSRKLPK